MRANDPQAELIAATDRTYGYPEFDTELLRLGIAPATAWRGPLVIGCERINVHGRFYEPHERGRKAYVVPVADSYEIGEFEPVDLVAFHPGEHRRFWSRIGVVPILNASAISTAVHGREPLMVLSSPLEWLRRGKNGCVILDEVDLGFWFGDVPEILTDCRFLYGRFAGALREPRLNAKLHMLSGFERVVA